MNSGVRVQARSNGRGRRAGVEAPMNGLLVVDKPVGPTSHDVVGQMRRTLGERRIGHTGTLDPGASGVLPLVIGSATRLARFLAGADKSYLATLKLGTATDSYDSHGTPVGPVWTGDLPGREAIERALDPFRGTFEQQPPALSAKKIQGERSHRLARRAAAARLDDPDAPSGPMPEPARVSVTRLHVVRLARDEVVLEVDCSAGFYVRSLAHDLGVRLGVGAHLTSLRRTRSGDLSLDRAVPLSALTNDPTAAGAAMTPVSQMLPGLPGVHLTAEGVVRARHGREVGPGECGGDMSPMWTLRAGCPPVVRLVGPEGDLVGLGEPSPTPGFLHPFVVLV